MDQLRLVPGSMASIVTSGEPLKKTALLCMKNWLFNRDPLNGLSKSPFNWVAFHPLYTQNNRSFESSVAQVNFGRVSIAGRKLGTKISYPQGNKHIPP